MGTVAEAEDHKGLIISSLLWTGEKVRMIVSRGGRDLGGNGIF
jgi:hypothetical protein